MDTTMSKAKKQKYWYLITHFECPPCGAEMIYRQRVFEKPFETHIWRVSYNGCLL